MFKKSSRTKPTKPLTDLAKPEPTQTPTSAGKPPSRSDTRPTPLAPNTPRASTGSSASSQPQSGQTQPGPRQSGTSQHMSHSSTATPTPTKPNERTPAAYELRRTPAHTLGGSAVEETPEPQLANLHVGKGLELKGKISSCDSLVIEGNVEAEIESGSLTVSETGQVKGDAQVEEAEIEGLFDGTLEVKGCLIIRATGKVSGTIHYGQLMIDQGGRLIGEVDVAPDQSAKKSSTTDTEHKKTNTKGSDLKPIVAAAE